MNCLLTVPCIPGIAVSSYVILSYLSVDGYNVIPGLAVSKIYSNSMLALLNSRLKIDGHGVMETEDVDDTWKSLEIRNVVQSESRENTVTLRRTSAPGNVEPEPLTSDG
jgi:hypothetical protein